jgi:hypothetical protein
MKSNAPEKVTYVVSGRGEFPLDMIRRDDSTFATPEDQATASWRLYGDNGKKDFRCVTLVTTSPVRRSWEPLRARWESFGWDVVQCRDEMFDRQTTGRPIPGRNGPYATAERTFQEVAEDILPPIEQIEKANAPKFNTLRILGTKLTPHQERVQFLIQHYGLDPDHADRLSIKEGLLTQVANAKTFDELKSVVIDLIMSMK